MKMIGKILCIGLITTLVFAAMIGLAWIFIGDTTLFWQIFRFLYSLLLIEWVFFGVFCVVAFLFRDFFDEK